MSELASGMRFGDTREVYARMRHVNHRRARQAEVREDRSTTLPAERAFPGRRTCWCDPTERGEWPCEEVSCLSTQCSFSARRRSRSSLSPGCSWLPFILLACWFASRSMPRGSAYCSQRQRPSSGEVSGRVSGSQRCRSAAVVTGRRVFCLQQPLYSPWYCCSPRSSLDEVQPVAPLGAVSLQCTIGPRGGQAGAGVHRFARQWRVPLEFPIRQVLVELVWRVKTR